MNHARTGELRWGVCGPSYAEIADVDTCLKNLENRCYYFRTANDAHHISTKANLNKLIINEKATIDEASVSKLVEETAVKELGISPLISVNPNVRYPEDVPDIPEFQLCMIPFDVLPGTDEYHAIDVAKRILNGNNRTYKRHLAFLSCNNNVKLKSLARRHLTYKSIKNKSQTYQLHKSDLSDIPSKINSTLEDLKDEIWNCYRNLHIGELDGTLSDKSGILGLITRSMSSEGISDIVVQRLTGRDTIVNAVSTRVLDKWPPAFMDKETRKPWTLQSLRDNVFQSNEVTKYRLSGVNGLKSSITEWVKDGKVIIVAVDSDGTTDRILACESTSAIELDAIIRFDNVTGILLPNDIPVNEEHVDVSTSEDDQAKASDEVEVEENFNEQEPDENVGSVDEAELIFTVPVKKLNSIVMSMSMNFDDATAKIEFKGTPRKGTGSNPISALKDAINSAGGEIED